MILPASFHGYEYSNDPSPEGDERPSADPKSIGTATILLQPELQIDLRSHDYSMGEIYEPFSILQSPTIFIRNVPKYQSHYSICSAGFDA